MYEGETKKAVDEARKAALKAAIATMIQKLQEGGDVSAADIIDLLQVKGKPTLSPEALRAKEAFLDYQTCQSNC
jgi:hypothetical protein